MTVRIYDSSTGTFFKSKVFAMINEGWYSKYLVVVQNAGAPYFKLFDYFVDRGAPNPIPTINIIVPQSIDNHEWVYEEIKFNDEHLRPFTPLRRDNLIVFHYNGYPWLLKNKSMIEKLLKGNIVPIYESGFANVIHDYKQNGYDYIETQEDINFLMELTHSFHDSILYEAKFKSRNNESDDFLMEASNNLRQVTMIFQSVWCRPVEMIFEGVTVFNLRPAHDNCCADIFSASLFVKDASVYFFTSDIEEIDLMHKGTWINAYSLRWRFLEKL